MNRWALLLVVVCGCANETSVVSTDGLVMDLNNATGRVVVHSPRPPKVARKQWEYRSVDFDVHFNKVSPQELNVLGKEGWELIELHQVPWYGCRGLFKREAQ